MAIAAHDDSEVPVPADRRIRKRSRSLRVLWTLLIVGALTFWLFPPLWKSTLHALAEASLKSHDATTALARLQLADRIGTASPETSLLRIQAARRTGDNSAIEAALLEAEQRGASTKALDRQRLLCAAQAGQLNKAVPHLSTLLTDTSADNKDVCLAFITGYLRNHRTKDALILIDAWLKDAPSDSYPWLIRGRIRRLRDDVVRAEADLRESVKLAGTWQEPVVELAEVLKETRRPEEAIPLFQSAMSDPSLQTRAAVGLALSLKATGDNSHADQVLKKVLETHPDDATVRLEVARTDFENADYEKAVAGLDRILATHPHHDEARYILAQSLQQLGRDAEAATQFSQVTEAREAHAQLTSLRDEIQKQPNDDSLLLSAGRLLLRYGDPEEGVVTLLAALDVNPHNNEAHELLAEYYEQHGDQNSHRQQQAQWHRSQIRPQQ